MHNNLVNKMNTLVNNDENISHVAAPNKNLLSSSIGEIQERP